MTRIKKLTPEQETLMATVREEWLDFVFKNDQPLNIAAARKGVAFAYELEKLERPLVIVLGSPVACQLAVGRQVHGQAYEQVGRQVHDKVYDKVRDQVNNQIHGRVSDQVYEQVRSQVRDQVYDLVSDQVYNQVYNQIRDQIRGQKLKYFSPARCDILWDAGWLSFYDYFKRLGVVNHDGLNKYISYSRSGAFYSFFLRGLAVLCDRPAYIKRDENSRLHADGAPAILWRDGWAQYFLHGVRVPADYALAPAGKLDPKLVLTEKNADIQRELVRKIGPERVLMETHAKELDNWQDPKTGFKYKLVDMVIGDNIRRRYLYFQHASMPGIFYAKPTAPECDQAWQARAWILSLIERDDLADLKALNLKKEEIISAFPEMVS